MDAIGGYFELELNNGEHYHPDAVCLNSARNCLELIICARKWKRVFLPYYSCSALLQPIKRQGIQTIFYGINKALEPTSFPQLHKDEAFLYINYFGLKDNTVKSLSKTYGEQLIVDNSQALYSPRIQGIDTFYSPRKFFGVPDGGYLYSDVIEDVPLNTDKSSINRIKHLCERIETGAESGYQDFKEAELELDWAPIAKMSNLTKRLLSNIDYQRCAKRRRENFLYLDSHLAKQNQLDISLGPNDVPMVYPLLVNKSIRQSLHERRLYVASYWDGINNYLSDSAFESYLSRYLIPLPIDQRYSQKDMDLIITIIESLIGE